jgi:hypothetical protein
MLAMERFDDLDPDPALTEEQAALAAALSAERLAEIDAALLRAASHRWRKLSRVVATAMYDLPVRIDGVPDVFYAQRVEVLVQAGRLEAFGDLRRMRYSEVRLPQSGHVGTSA